MKRSGLPFAALIAFALTGALAAALTGCSLPNTASDDGVIRIVASTNVYGDIAQAIGGSAVDVTAVISDPDQDPHTFEANAQVQLALSKADIVIENGGGYDAFVDILIAGANNPDATVINAVRLKVGDVDPTVDGVNEHVWYDLPTMRALAITLADSLARLDPDAAPTYRANAEKYSSSIDALEARVAEVAAEFAGTRIVITEPVPLYLLEAMGLVNVTPAEFSDAIEEDRDVPPLALQGMLAQLKSGNVAVLVYNAQTGDPATEQLLAAARKAGVPIVPVTETLPADTDYLTWMLDNVRAVEHAVEQAMR